MNKRIDMRTAGMVIKKIAQWSEEAPIGNEEKWEYIKRMMDKGYITDEKFTEIVSEVFDELKEQIASQYTSEIISKIVEELE